MIVSPNPEQSFALPSGAPPRAGRRSARRGADRGRRQPNLHPRRYGSAPGGSGTQRARVRLCRLLSAAPPWLFANATRPAGCGGPSSTPGCGWARWGRDGCCRSLPPETWNAAGPRGIPAASAERSQSPVARSGHARADIHVEDGAAIPPRSPPRLASAARPAAFAGTRGSNAPSPDSGTPAAANTRPPQPRSGRRGGAATGSPFF